MKQSLKIVLSIILVILVVASLSTAGCKTATSAATTIAETTAAETKAAETKTAETTAAEEVTLTWTEWWDSEWGEELMDNLIATFEKQNPGIKINRIYNGWVENYNKTLVMAQAGEPADIMGMEGIWISSLDKLGALEDLGPWFDKEGQEYKDRFVDPAFVKYKGQIKAVYMYVYPFSLAYNTKIFKEKGLEPPKSLDDFKVVLKNLRDKKTNTYGTALPMSAEAAYHIMMIYGLTLAQFGGKYVDDNGMAAFNTDAGVKALQYLKDLVDEDLVVPGSLGMTAVQTREFFGSEQIALTYDGPFIATISKQRNPDIQLAFVPQMHTTTGGYIVGGSGLSMSAKSKHKEEAWKFIKYMMSDEVADILMKTTSLPWGLKSIAENPFVASDPVLKECGAMVNDPATILFPVTPEADAVQRAFIDNLQACIKGTKDAKTAIADAAKEWDKIIESSK